MTSTPEGFTNEEVDAIRAAFKRREGPVTCPRCHRALTAGKPQGGGGTVPPVYELRCPQCGGRTIASAGR